MHACHSYISTKDSWVIRATAYSYDTKAGDNKFNFQLDINLVSHLMI